jgi:hypothetical protein
VSVRPPPVTNLCNQKKRKHYLSIEKYCTCTCISRSPQSHRERGWAGLGWAGAEGSRGSLNQTLLFVELMTPSGFKAYGMYCGMYIAQLHMVFACMCFGQNGQENKWEKGKNVMHSIIIILPRMLLLLLLLLLLPRCSKWKMKKAARYSNSSLCLLSSMKQGGAGAACSCQEQAKRRNKKKATRTRTEFGICFLLLYNTILLARRDYISTLFTVLASCIRF